MGIWCRIEVKHVSDMFRSLRYDSYKQNISIIVQNLNIFSWNVRKNKLLTNTILEVQTDTNIIFI